MRRRSGGFVTRPLAKWSHTLPKADSDQNAIALPCQVARGYMDDGY